MVRNSGDRKKRRLWPKLALFFGSLVVLFLALEGGLRLAGYGAGLARYFAPEIGYLFYPNQSRTMMGENDRFLARLNINEVGCRGPCYEGAKPPGVVRIACLGDSFTLGWAVEDEEAYPFLLERMLGEPSSSSRFQVMNFGHPGFNTVNELNHYRKFVRSWIPDIVILGYVLNDPQPEGVGPRYMDNFIFRLFGRTAMLEAFHRHLRNKISLFRPRLTPEKVKFGNRYRENRKTIEFNPEAEVAKPFWERSMQALETLVKEVKADGARFLLVSFPAPYQCIKLRKASRKGTDALEMIWSEEVTAQAYLERQAGKLEIPFLDLLPAYIKLKPCPYGPLDMHHPGVPGYRAAAAEVARAIREYGLL